MNTGYSFLDRLIEKLDQVDPTSVQNCILRLVREKGFLETVFNTIHEGIVVLDRDLRIHYANSAACSLLGFPEDFEKQRIDRFLRDVDWERLMTADPAEWHRISMQEIEVFYPTHRFLNYYLVPVQEEQVTDDEDFPLATMIIHDVTALHRNTEQAIESHKIQAITMLAAGVAHEIGNPLNSLNIHLQLLDRRLSRSDDETLATEGRQLLEVASNEVKRLDTIINNFLQAVRPPEPNMERIQIKDILSEALGFMRREIEDRGILVEAAWAEKIPDINGDADLLKQAFYNIIKNAIQAMADGGLLRIGCREMETMIEIQFADTGKGIGQEEMPRIMDPYYTTRPDGSGLGLWIVEQIVRSHGGELGIDSEKGAGTVISVRLPLFDRKVRLLQAPRQESSEEGEES